MIQHFDFQQLAGPDQVAGDFDVGFARGRIPAGMVVLWDAGTYVLPYGKECWADSVASVIAPPRPTHEQVKAGV